MSDKFGRRHLLLVAAGIRGLGSLASTLARHTPMLIAGRIITGVGIGQASFTVPVHISEFAPEQDRGRMVSLSLLMVIAGTLLACMVDLAFCASGKWRWM